MAPNDFIEIPLFDENTESIMRRDFIVKSYIKGDPFMNRPYKTNVVSYVDAESTQSGQTEKENGIIDSFVCDRCKKQFKANKARAIKICLNEMMFDKECSLSPYRYERAFCGKCYKKAMKLTRSIYDAICDFDEGEMANKERIFNSEISESMKG